MRTIHKTKEQLMSEVAELRQRVAELEKAEAERKRAEEALRESEETLRAIVENAPDAIFIHDLMGNFVDGNRKAEELIGYSKEELIGKNFFEAGLIPEARVLDVIAGLEQSRRGEIGKRCELELITKQGSRVYVEIAGLAIAGKENVQVLGFARDITERKRVEEEVQRNSKRLEALYAISQAVSHTLNLDELLNEALGRVLEVMDTDVGGIYLLDFQARVFILRAHIGLGSYRGQISEGTPVQVGPHFFQPGNRVLEGDFLQGHSPSSPGIHRTGCGASSRPLTSISWWGRSHLALPSGYFG